MGRRIKFLSRGQKEILKGINASLSQIRSTLGPSGRNILIDFKGVIFVTNDGYRISVATYFSNKFKDIGARLLRLVTERMNREVGDATSTGSVLYGDSVRFVLHSIMRNPVVESFYIVYQWLFGVNTMIDTIKVQKGMEDASQVAINFLKEIAIPTNEKIIKQVATISAQSEERGELVAEMTKTVGEHGVITVEESPDNKLSSTIVEGYEVKSGYASPMMVTNYEKARAEYENVPVLVMDKYLTDIRDIFPVMATLEKVHKKKDLIVIAKDIEIDVIKGFIFNKNQGIFNVLAIKEAQSDILQDVAVSVGATVISDDEPIRLDSEGQTADLTMLGNAKQVIAGKDNCIFIGGVGSKEKVAERVSIIKDEIKEAEEIRKDFLQKRIAKLTGGIGVIRVGAPTEDKMHYLKDKMDDAVLAVRAAMPEGVVPGGGVSLVKASNAVQERLNQIRNTLTKEEIIGYEVVIKTLLQPYIQILKNSGVRNIREIVNKTKKSKVTSGYSVLDGEFKENFYEEGIVDALKAERMAIDIAIGAAALLATVFAYNTDEEIEQQLSTRLS